MCQACRGEAWERVTRLGTLRQTVQDAGLRLDPSLADD